MHASPTGPHPSTTALSLLVIRLLATACTPTGERLGHCREVGVETRRDLDADQSR